MCMDVQDSEKMGERSLDDDVQIIEVHIDKANKVTVKQERPDEAEIRELAAKMVEANKAKMGTIIQQQQQQQTAQQRQTGVLQSQNTNNLLSYFSSNSNKRSSDVVVAAAATVAAAGATTTTATAAAKSAQAANNSGVDSRVPPLDDESHRGRFGWSTFGDTHIPYILRAGEKYCAVRILESKLLNKYLNCLHPDIYSCTCIRSYYITEVESKLLNEINVKHCENQFGREQFTIRDLVVRLADARDFYTFLDVCYTKLTPGATPSIGGQKVDKCGFIRINKESVVPYTVKDGLKYVPLFYFEGETENLKLKAEKLEGWDLAYLKFCCKAQGIRNELFASETCSVISLSDIKGYFPPGTNFEDYWPNKVIELLMPNNKGAAGSGGGWTKQPATPPMTRTAVGSNAASKANAMNVRTANVQSVMQQRGGSTNPASINSTIQRGGQARTVSVTHHTSHTSSTIVSSGRNSSMLNAVQAAVNGWSGLVGGQPTFQTLVSQANSIIRMPNPPLSMHNQIPTTTKSYSSQSRSRGASGGTAAYPVYPVSTMQNAVHVQPPPLVRASAHSNQPNLGVSATYTTPSLGVQNVVNASTYPQMLGLSAEQVQALMPQTSATTLLPHSQRHTPPIHNASQLTKYPPPLIPVNNNNNSNNNSNSSSNSNNSCRDSRGRKQLIPIPDTHPSVGCQVQPYQVSKALVEDKFVFCINFKPYVYTELLMTLPDFVSQYFPNCDISSCRQVLTEVLCVDLYQGNRLQMEMLQKAGKCSSLNEELPLIQVQSIMKYMRQLKYMLDNRNMAMPTHSTEEHPSKKRQRTS